MLREYVYRMCVNDIMFEDTVRAYSDGEARQILEARYGRGSVVGGLSERIV